MADDRFQLQGLDHLVLRCADIENTLAWYTEVLGLAPDHVEEWRAGEASFPSVRISPTAILDLVGGGDGADGRLDHLCIVVEPCDLAAVAAARGLEVLEGPVPRSGAQGTGTSIYVKDPDGCTVEIRHY